MADYSSSNPLEWTPADWQTDWKNQEPDTQQIITGINQISGEVTKELYFAICCKIGKLQDAPIYRLELENCILDVGLEDGHILLNIVAEYDTIMLEITPIGIALYGDGVYDIDETIAANIHIIIHQLLYKIDELRPAEDCVEPRSYQLPVVAGAVDHTDWSELVVCTNDHQVVSNMVNVAINETAEDIRLMEL